MTKHLAQAALRSIDKACMIVANDADQVDDPAENARAKAVAATTNRLRRQWALCQSEGEYCMSVVTDETNRPLQQPRRQVVIRRDGDDFVIALQPEDLIVFRNESAGALRRACSFLRWEVVSDVIMEPNDPAT
jgi:hypothetical protein